MDTINDRAEQRTRELADILTAKGLNVTPRLEADTLRLETTDPDPAIRLQLLAAAAYVMEHGLTFLSGGPTFATLGFTD